MRFESAVLAYHSYGSGSPIGRMTCWWTPDQRKGQAATLLRALKELGRGMLVDLYLSAAEDFTRHVRPVSTFVESLTTSGLEDLLGPDASKMLWLVASPDLENQIELAMSSASREAARAFPDPDYAPRELWGDSTLWPNRFAREIGARIASAPRTPDRLDVDSLAAVVVSYLQRLRPGSSLNDLDFSYSDILLGLIWLDDSAALGALLGTLADRGIDVPSTEGRPWTIETLLDWPIYAPWSQWRRA